MRATYSLKHSSGLKTVQKSTSFKEEDISGYKAGSHIALLFGGFAHFWYPKYVGKYSAYYYDSYLELLPPGTVISFVQE